MLVWQTYLTCFALLPLLLPTSSGNIDLNDDELQILNCIFHMKSNCSMLQRNAAATLFRKAVDPPPLSGQSIVRLYVYMEAKCPDTTRFIQSQLWPTWQKLGKNSRFQVTLIPFGKARCYRKEDDFQCYCQHGPEECMLNQLMNCLMDAHPRTEDYLPHIHCVQGRNDLEDARASCLVGQEKLDEKHLMECANGKRGRRLLARAGEKTEALYPKMDVVPWIVINDKRNEEALDDLKSVVCSFLNDPKLKECY